MKKDYNKKIKDIIKLVCEETGVTYVELCSRRRTANLLKARAVYVAVCLKLTDFSLEEIGKTISKNANLGFCEFFWFKCAGARVCDAWVGGGPIK